MDEQQKDRNIEAIAKIIELTRNDKIIWSLDSSDLVKKTNDETIFSVYIAKYNKSLLRIYEKKYLTTVYVGLTFVDILKNNKPKTEKHWLTDVVLEIIDPSGESLWGFPKNPILKDLLKLIKFKVSGADDLITSLLNE